MNEIYLRHFNFEKKPSRTCVAVKTLPLNAKIEIECIALVP
jgi:2-iminobutanoate/2-iminopropanoate deaminase